MRTYEVHDAYRFSGGLLSGWTTVTLRTTEQLSSFDLDFLLPVRSVHLSTGGSTFSRPSRHELRIQPRHAIAAGTTVRVRVAYAGHPGRLAWRGESNWTGHQYRGDGPQRASHGGLVVPRERPPARQGADGPPPHRAADETGGGRRPPGRGTPDGEARDVPLALGRDGHLPGVLRGRPLRGPSRHRRPPPAVLPRRLPRPAAQATEGGHGRAAAHQRHRPLAEPPPRPLPLRADRWRGHRAQPGVLPGDPDPPDVPPRREPPADGPRAGPPVVRRLGLGPPLGGRLAQRRLRDVHGAALERGPRRLEHVGLAAPDLRLRARRVVVLGPPGRRPGAGRSLRLGGLRPRVA